MDPNACLIRLLEAIESDDREETIYALGDLLDWTRKGGFLPDVKVTETMTSQGTAKVEIFRPH